MACTGRRVSTGWKEFGAYHRAMRGHGNHWGAALALELAPAALINFATAFAVASLMRQSGFAGLAAAASLAAGIAAFLVAWFCLRRVGPSRGRFALPAFATSALQASSSEDDSDLPELLLDDRLAAMPAEQQSIADELLLDDILEKLGPDSRVVRLFDPKAVPTAGELQSRIDRHLQSASPQPAPPDATQALHDALLALRQSLR